MLRFLLLGASDCANPSAITKEQLKTWESQALITYLGESSEVRDHIGSCSCVVLPSYYKEGVPRVLLEAMSMGKPIITTNVSGCKECIKPPFASEGELLIGENGILIPPKDPTALAHALQALAALPRTQLLEMGEAGRQYAKERFDITRVIASYHDAIASYHDTTASYHRTPALHKDAPAPTESIDSKKSIESTQSKKARLAFVSNTAFAMLCFRRNVLESLHKAGYEIHIIAPLDSHALALRECGFYTHHIEIDSKGLNPLKDFRTALHLRKILQSLKPAMVFNYTIKPAIYGSLVANALHIPNIAVITGLGYVFIDGGRKRAMLRVLVCAMYKIALKTTKQVWFLNSDDKAQFLESNLITPAQAFLLDSEGVDTRYFSPHYGTHGAIERTHKAHTSPAQKPDCAHCVADMTESSAPTPSTPSTLAKSTLEATTLNAPAPNTPTTSTPNALGAPTPSTLAPSAQDFRALLIARMLWDKGVGEFVEAARILLDTNKGGGYRLEFFISLHDFSLPTPQRTHFPFLCTTAPHTTPKRDPLLARSHKACPSPLNHSLYPHTTRTAV